MATPKDVKELAEFEKIKDLEKPSLFDFHAKWCEPCKKIAPLFEQLAAENPEVGFYRVDVDDAFEVARRAGVTSMPTFIVYNDGFIVDHEKGAVPQLLQRLVEAAKKSIAA